ncbi:hypothetical protein AB0G79_13060 [Streptomyces sp. NPDC020807]|uniref:hypothetical protein n=1 Tax=Streptomyces sp. NPDC020807 TaxID=3155119 RepID=UPI0033C2E2F1
MEASLVCVEQSSREGDSTSRLARIDAAAGRTMWSVPMPDDRGYSPAVRGRTIAVSAPGGLRAYAPADGLELRSLKDKAAFRQVPRPGAGILYARTETGWTSVDPYGTSA